MQKGVESLVILQTIFQSGLDQFRVIHVHVELAQINLGCLAGALLNLLGNEVGSVLGLRRALPDAVRNVDVAEDRHQHEHHAADGQHQLGFQADSYHVIARDERGDGGIIAALPVRQKDGTGQPGPRIPDAVRMNSDSEWGGLGLFGQKEKRPQPKSSVANCAKVFEADLGGLSQCWQ